MNYYTCMLRQATNGVNEDHMFWSGGNIANPRAIPIYKSDGTTIFKLNDNEIATNVTIQGNIARGASIYAPDELYLCTSTGRNGPHSFLLRFGLSDYSSGGTNLSHTGYQPAYSTEAPQQWHGCFNLNLKGKALYIFDTNANPSAHIRNCQVKITTVIVPKVTIGDVITKSQMDVLKDYQYYASNGSTNPTAATQGDKATAALANTYGRGTVSQGGLIQAGWYGV